MFVDQTSLLLALGFAAFALATTLFVTWLSARSERFILLWATGAGVMVFGFAGFSIYAVTSIYVLLWISNMLLTGSFVIFYGAACLFTEKHLPQGRVTALGGLVATAITLPFIVGFDALGAMTGNIANALVLATTAKKFWDGREEAPLWVGGIVGLYSLTALSFIPCAVMIFVKGPLVLSAPPSGWAEDLNSIIGLIGLTGIGALSLALNQARVSRTHQQAANTDALTGLLNRRAIFERYDRSGLDTATATIIFDLDHFKSINDRHGHAAGDEALKRFANVLRQHGPANAAIARLGGEEFILVAPQTDAQRAFALAEAIRASFALELVQGPAGAFHGTVSAGLAMGLGTTDSFEAALRRADDALYAAKHGGRNRVVTHEETLEQALGNVRKPSA
nr:GGDEF domain-containing protein [uncultured Devosia sp.]